VPRNGAYWLSEYAGRTVEFLCIKCERAGAASADDLLAEFGDQSMPSLRYHLASRFGCTRGPNAPINETCKLSYAGAGTVMLKEEPKADDDRTIGELAEYNTIFAQCLACKRRKPVSRWEIQRRFGKDVTMGALAKAMRCKCGKKGASLYLGNMSR